MSFDLNTYYPDVTINGRLVGSLCQFCENSVPSIYKEQGCSWSRFLKPVEGWKATPTIMGNPLKKGLVTSFCVHECPKFKQDSDIIIPKG